jgi:hypothetical protein
VRGLTQRRQDAEKKRIATKNTKRHEKEEEKE